MWRVFNKTFGFAYSFCCFQKQRKQAKTAPFLSAKQRTPFLNIGGYFRKTKNSHPHLRFVWLTLPRSGTFVSNDDFLDHHRPEAKEADRRATTKKCGSPLTEPLNWENRPGSGLPPFLFPILKYIIQCHIQSRFHTLVQNSEYLRL